MVNSFSRILVLILVPGLLADPSFAILASQPQSRVGTFEAGAFLAQALEPAAAPFTEIPLSVPTTRRFFHAASAEARPSEKLHLESDPDAHFFDEPIEPSRDNHLIDAFSILVRPSRQGPDVQKPAHLAFALIGENSGLHFARDEFSETIRNALSAPRALNISEESARQSNLGLCTVEFVQDLRDAQGNPAWVTMTVDPGRLSTIRLHSAIVPLVKELNESMPNAGDLVLAFLLSSTFQSMKDSASIAAHKPLASRAMSWDRLLSLSEFHPQFDSASFWQLLIDKSILTRTDEPILEHFRKMHIQTQERTASLQHGQAFFDHHYAMVNLDSHFINGRLNHGLTRDRLTRYLSALVEQRASPRMFELFLARALPAALEDFQGSGFSERGIQHTALLLAAIYGHLPKGERAAFAKTALTLGSASENPRAHEIVLRFLTTATATHSGAVIPLQAIIANVADLHSLTLLAIRSGWSDFPIYLRHFEQFSAWRFILSGTSYGTGADWKHFARETAEALALKIPQIPAEWLSPVPVAIHMPTGKGGLTDANPSFPSLRFAAGSKPDEIFWHEYVGHLLFMRVSDILDWMWVLKNHGWRLYIPGKNVRLTVVESPEGKLEWEAMSIEGQIRRLPPESYSFNDLVATYMQGAEFPAANGRDYLNLVDNGSRLLVPSEYHVFQRSGASGPSIATPRLFNAVKSSEHVYGTTHPLEQVAEAVGTTDSRFHSESHAPRPGAPFALVDDARHAQKSQHRDPYALSFKDVEENLLGLLRARLLVFRRDDGSAYRLTWVAPAQEEAFASNHRDAVRDPSSGVWRVPLTAQEAAQPTVYERFRQQQGVAAKPFDAAPEAGRAASQRAAAAHLAGNIGHQESDKPLSFDEAAKLYMVDFWLQPVALFRVHHEQWGDGTVNTESLTEDRVEIKFDSDKVGVKKLVRKIIAPNLTVLTVFATTKPITFSQEHLTEKIKKITDLLRKALTAEHPKPLYDAILGEVAEYDGSELGAVEEEKALHGALNAVSVDVKKASAALEKGKSVIIRGPMSRSALMQIIKNPRERNFEFAKLQGETFILIEPGLSFDDTNQLLGKAKNISIFQSAETRSNGGFLTRFIFGTVHSHPADSDALASEDDNEDLAQRAQALPHGSAVILCAQQDGRTLEINYGTLKSGYTTTEHDAAAWKTLERLGIVAPIQKVSAPLGVNRLRRSV